MPAGREAGIVARLNTTNECLSRSIGSPPEKGLRHGCAVAPLHDADHAPPLKASSVHPEYTLLALGSVSTRYSLSPTRKMMALEDIEAAQAEAAASMPQLEATRLAEGGPRKSVA